MSNALNKKLLNIYVFKDLIKRKKTLKRAVKDPAYWITAQNKEIADFVKYIYIF